MNPFLSALALVSVLSQQQKAKNTNASFIWLAQPKMYFQFRVFFLRPQRPKGFSVCWSHLCNIQLQHPWILALFFKTLISSSTMSHSVTGKTRMGKWQIVLGQWESGVWDSRRNGQRAKLTGCMSHHSGEAGEGTGESETLGLCALSSQAGYTGEGWP